VKEMKKPERNIHGDHQELAVGEIDDLHHPEDESETDARKGINAAEQDARNEELEK
jgi:hypothetical protein